MNYRPSSDLRRECATCVMFLKGRLGATSHCTLVEGAIFDNDTCDRWFKKK